jgi:hypothetical protein
MGYTFHGSPIPVRGIYFKNMITVKYSPGWCSIILCGYGYPARVSHTDPGTWEICDPLSKKKRGDRMPAGLRYDPVPGGHCREVPPPGPDPVMGSTPSAGRSSGKTVSGLWRVSPLCWWAPLGCPGYSCIFLIACSCSCFFFEERG